MRLRITLALPRDRRTVPLARHVLHQALHEIGVTTDCSHDIEVALTEACANALDHANDGDEYEVRAEVSDDACTISVCDNGHGFDWQTWSPDLGLSERGRGISLMHGLVDAVGFATTPDQGTEVQLRKSLAFEPAR